MVYYLRMSKRLPRLRHGLDFFPSPVPERPGLLLRDPLGYTDEILIIPPLLAQGLFYFDGEQTELDLQAHFSQLAGQIVSSEVVLSMVEALQNQGFLETEEFERLREKRLSDFAAAEVRVPAHAGSAYPEEVEALRRKLDGYLDDPESTPPQSDGASNDELTIALAAPHVSPEGGWKSYAAAYNRLRGPIRSQLRDRTIILLGTSHYGAPERFGLTRKPFVTPLGSLQVDTGIVDRLESRAGDSIIMEDYCHAIEHSIEFQCLFLQQALGSEFKIVPILCGPFAKGLMEGEPPESDDQVRRFFDALSEIAEVEQHRTFWVLGIDLAHVGRRYGDSVVALADRDEMLEVKEMDSLRLDRVCAGDAEGFFDRVSPDQDPLKWCGLSPLYTFLKTAGNVEGKVLRYEQWNIDPQSVVSFVAMDFKTV